MATESAVQPRPKPDPTATSRGAAAFTPRVFTVFPGRECSPGVKEVPECIFQSVSAGLLGEVLSAFRSLRAARLEDGANSAGEKGGSGD